MWACLSGCQAQCFTSWLCSLDRFCCYLEVRAGKTMPPNSNKLLERSFASNDMTEVLFTTDCQIGTGSPCTLEKASQSTWRFLTALSCSYIFHLCLSSYTWNYEVRTVSKLQFLERNKCKYQVTSISLSDLYLRCLDFPLIMLERLSKPLPLL